MLGACILRAGESRGGNGNRKGRFDAVQRACGNNRRALGKSEQIACLSVNTDNFGIRAFVSYSIGMVKRFYHTDGSGAFAGDQGDFIGFKRKRSNRTVNGQIVISRDCAVRVGGSDTGHTDRQSADFAVIIDGCDLSVFAGIENFFGGAARRCGDGKGLGFAERNRLGRRVKDEFFDNGVRAFEQTAFKGYDGFA